MTLPRYPEYRASGVEWLGEVPAHWGFGPLGHFLSRSDSGAWGSEDDPEGTVVLRSTNQTADGKWCLAEPARRILSARERSLTRLDLGDLLMTKSSGSFLHIGKTTYVDLKIAALNAGYSNFMQRLRCGVKLDPKFSYWILNSALSREQFSVLATTSTGLGNLNRGVISSVQVTAPPLPEQHAIVAYLDRETARIDDLIDKKRRLLSLLKERRTAIITHAVTKGLPTEEARAAGLPVDPPMKDSGVEWLGEVPAHWSVGQLRQVMSMKSGLAITSDNISETGYYPVYGGNGIRGYTDRHTHDGQFVLIGRQGALCGNVHFVNGQFWASEHAVAVTIGRNLVPRFSYYLLGEMNLNQYSVAAAQPGLAVNRVLALLGVLPPPAEQHAIVAYLDRETARIDELTAKVEQAIELLGEYRTALITAAVTGQVDVRGAMEA